MFLLIVKDVYSSNQNTAMTSTDAIVAEINKTQIKYVMSVNFLLSLARYLAVIQFILFTRSLDKDREASIINILCFWITFRM